MLNRLIACALTVLVETGFFLASGYREKDFLLLCVCANTITNLCLNMLLSWLYILGVRPVLAIYPLETAAVIAEYMIYAALLGRSRKLFGMVLLANMLSYGLGLLLYGHV